jgi:hypothetical protein
MMKKALVAVLLFSVSIFAVAQFQDADTPGQAVYMKALNYVYNGSTYDRWRGSALTGGTGIGLVSIAGKGDPCLSSESVKSSAIINVSTAATTQLVALSGTTVVYVCGFNFTISQVATTANTLKFVQGTGASCGTGTADLTGAFGTGGITAGVPIVVSSSSEGTDFKTAAGSALCVTTTIGATAAFTGVVTYVQL